MHMYMLVCTYMHTILALLVAYQFKQLYEWSKINKLQELYIYLTKVLLEHYHNYFVSQLPLFS